MGFRVLGFLVLVFGFRVSGFGFRVSPSGCRVSGFGFWASGFGSRVAGFGYRVETVEGGSCTRFRCYCSARVRGRSREFRSAHPALPEEPPAPTQPPGLGSTVQGSAGEIPDLIENEFQFKTLMQ